MQVPAWKCKHHSTTSPVSASVLEKMGKRLLENPLVEQNEGWLMGA